ncbi:hypothetical protein [Neisseria dumasiana]|nr:hypothetical protein [Neisseria dumasiana]
MRLKHIRRAAAGALAPHRFFIGSFEQYQSIFALICPIFINFAV